MNENITRLELQVAQAHDVITRIGLMAELSKEVCWVDAKRALALAEEAEALSEQAHYELGVYVSRLCRGRAYNQLSEYEQALNCLLPCAEYFARIGDRRELLSHQNMGFAYHRLGEYALAMESWSTSLRLARAGDDRSALAQCLLNMGVIYQGLGDFVPAMGYGMESLEILRNLDDPRCLLFCYLQLAATCGGLRNYDQTIEYLQCGLALGSAAHDTHAHAMLLSNIGTVYVYMGEHEKAVEWLRRSLAFQISVGDRVGEAVTLKALGLECLKLGDLEQALHYLGEGLTLAHDIGNRFEEAAIQLGLGELFLRQGDHDRAIGYLEEAISLSGRSEAKVVLSEGHRLISLAFERRTEFKKALEHYKKHVVLERELFGAEVQREVAMLQKRHDLGGGVGIRGGVAPQADVIRRCLGEMRALSQGLVLLNHWLVRQRIDKSEAVSRASHDLRGPLTAIQVNVSFLKQLIRGEVPEEVELGLQDIELSAERAASIIGELLSSSVLGAGEAQLLAQTFELGGTVREVIRASSPAARPKRIVVEYSSETESLYVHADQATTARIIGELVSNAIKFSPPGRRIWMRWWGAGGCAWCEVRDEGPGLSDADQGGLFQRFSRLSPKPTGGEPSSGLGLAIVRRLVEAMGGRVSARSELGTGTAFLLQLPLAEFTTTVGPVRAVQ